MSRQIAGKEENVLSLGLKYFSCPLFTMKQNNKAKHIFFYRENRCFFVDGKLVYGTFPFWMIRKQLKLRIVFWGNNNWIVTICAGQIRELL